MNLWASKRISIQLLRRANRGARGKATTKMVMKPYWMTEGEGREGEEEKERGREGERHNKTSTSMP